MDEKIKTWPLRFPAKENPKVKKALFDWPIVLQYDGKAKYRLISRKFSGVKFFHPIVRLTNQKPRVFVSVSKTNQIALFPFVCCFCFVPVFSVQSHTKIALLLNYDLLTKAIQEMYLHSAELNVVAVTENVNTFLLTTPENTKTYHNALCLSPQHFA